MGDTRKNFPCRNTRCPSPVQYVVPLAEDGPAGWVHIWPTTCQWPQPVPYCTYCDSTDLTWTDDDGRTEVFCNTCVTRTIVPTGS